MADWSEARLGSTTFGWPTSSPGTAVHNLSATTSGVGYYFQPKTTDAITHLGFRYGTRTGTPPTYVIGIEGVSTSTGNPDATYKQSGGIDCKATFTPPASTAWDSTWQWVALAQSYVPTQGQDLIATIRYSSGTVDGTNFSSIANELSNGVSSGVVNDPYSLRLTAGSWAKRSSLPLFAYRTANNRRGIVYQGNYTTTTASTVGDRSAVKFVIPSGSCSTLTIKGLRLWGVLAGASGKEPILGIWDSGGAVATKTLDTDFSSNASSRFMREYLFTADATLTAGTTYYAGLEVGNSTSGSLGVAGIQLSEANDQLAYPFGTQWCLSTYSSGAWTDDQTVRPFLELILEDVTASASSGGGVLIANGALIR